MVIIMVDPTYESITIAERVTRFCVSMNVKHVWSLLNNIHTAYIKKWIFNELIQRKINVLGIVHHDKSITKAGLKGSIIDECKAQDELRKVVNKLETMGIELDESYKQLA